MFRIPIFGFSCTCLLVRLCLTLSHTWQQGVWCFRCRLQPGLRLLLLTVGSHIFAYPSAAVPSHAGLIHLAILPNRSAVSAPEPPSSALPVSAPEPPAQALSLLPHLHQTTTLQRLHTSIHNTSDELMGLGPAGLCGSSSRKASQCGCAVPHARCWGTALSCCCREAWASHNFVYSSIVVDWKMLRPSIFNSEYMS